MSWKNILKENDIEKRKCPKCGKTHSTDLELASCGSHRKASGAVGFGASQGNTKFTGKNMFNSKVVSPRKRKKED